MSAEGADRGRRAWWLLLLVPVIALALGMILLPSPPALPVIGPMAAFSLKDQDGRAVTDKDLLGKVQIVDFIFTNCPDTCPTLTAKMSGLQRQIPGEAVGLVSFTVDPDRDTPEAMAAFAARFGADHSRWRFLTGDAAQLRGVVRSMMLAAEKAEPGPDGSYNVVHSEKFVLLDRQSRIRGFYSANTEGLAQLVIDAGLLRD